jgi:hypothetical protein
VRAYQNKVNALLSSKASQLLELNLREKIALKSAPSIILPRVEYGFRQMEISAVSGGIQVLLLINACLVLVSGKYFLIAILIPLFLLSLFLYAAKLPAASITDDLKRINFHMTQSNKIGESYDFSVDEYKKLVEKFSVLKKIS